MDPETIDFEIRFFEKLIRQKPDYVEALIPLAEAYTRKGLLQKGLTLDRRLARLVPDDPVIHYNLACSYALLGKKTQMMLYLKKSLSLGYRDLEHMRLDPDFKSFHGDPDFEALFLKAVMPRRRKKKE